MESVSKDFKFEAAHRLIKDYPGRCKHLHGHSFHGSITVALRDGAPLDKYDFVKDYGDFKKVQEWIDQNWDHASLINEDDYWLKLLVENNQRHFTFKGNPTSEIIGRFLFKKASEILNDDRTEVVAIKVNETCTSAFEYSK